MPSSQFDLLLAIKQNGAQEVASQVKGIGTASQQTANATNALPTSFAKVTQTASGMNTQITKTHRHTIDKLETQLSGKISIGISKKVTPVTPVTPGDEGVLIITTIRMNLSMKIVIKMK